MVAIADHGLIGTPLEKAVPTEKPEDPKKPMATGNQNTDTAKG